MMVLVLALAMMAKRRQELCMLVLPRLLSLFRCYAADRRNLVKSGGNVIFGSTGAVVGIEGCAAVADGLIVDVGGLKGGKERGEKGVTLELTGLPIHGNVQFGL